MEQENGFRGVDVKTYWDYHQLYVGTTNSHGQPQVFKLKKKDSDRISTLISSMIDVNTKFTIDGSVEGSYLTNDAKVHTGFSTSTETKITRQRQEVIDQEITVDTEIELAEFESYGILIEKAHVRLGGFTTEVLISTQSIKLTRDKVKELLLKGKIVSGNLVKIPENSWGMTIDEKNKVIPNNFYYQPKGVTSHEQQWLMRDYSNDKLDNKHVIDLPHSMLVVCHHNDFKWVGGPNCNCTNVDDHNVIVRQYTDFGYPE